MKNVAVTIVVLGLFALTGLSQDIGERMESARNELKKLETRAENLPRPPKLNVRAVPIPAPRLLLLIEDIHRFAAVNGDLDLAPTAHLLEARVCLAIADPADAIEACRRAMRHERANPYHKVAALTLSASTRMTYGDFTGAVQDFESLLKEHAANSNAENWRQLLNAGKSKEARQANDEKKITALATDSSSSNKQRARGRALRFAAAFPLAKFSEKSLTSTLASMAKATDAQKCATAERLAFYFPKSSQWANASKIVVVVFAKEGEYEKALLHTQNLLNRSEVLKGRESAQMGTYAKNLKLQLAKIYARPLEANPKTKQKRLAHFLKFAKPYAEPAEVVELAEGLRADYPGMSELPQISWILARTHARESPEEAQKLYREIAEKHPESQWGFDALEKARDLMLAIEGAEATEKWLKEISASYPGAAEQIKLALSRTDLLNQLERWEDAIALLIPLKDKTVGQDQEEITRRLAEYKKSLGD